MTSRIGIRSCMPRLAAALAAASSVLWPLGAGAAAVEEYQVKAVFLYNFARMVDWPSHLSTVSLCILGQDAFGRDVDVLSGRPVGQAKLQVRRIGADGVSSCQVLFVPTAEEDQLGRVLDGARGRPVLTVAETPGAAERGAVLNFYLEQNKVRFEVNLDAARRTGLPISSQLLKLARITHDRK